MTDRPTYCGKCGGIVRPAPDACGIVYNYRDVCNSCQEFYRFWYDHITNDLIRPPLVNIDPATVRYIWDAAKRRIAEIVKQPADMTQQGPAELWLQLHGDCDDLDEPVDYTAGSVSWCWHKVNDSDVRYVRADVAGAVVKDSLTTDGVPAPEPAKPYAWVRRHPDGTLVGDLLADWEIGQMRKDSGAWVPLFPAVDVEGSKNG